MNNRLQYNAKFFNSYYEINRNDWNELVGSDYPFARYEFLSALETTNCTSPEKGWSPCPMIMYEGQSSNKIVAVSPIYVKGNSLGEFVFDQTWADTMNAIGIDYYPKLVSTIPFTPATGPRLFVNPGFDEFSILTMYFDEIKKFIVKNNLSSWHVLFHTKDELSSLKSSGLNDRLGCQFHWENADYETFDQFLAALSHSSRKMIKKERKRILEGEQQIYLKRGEDISSQEWVSFFELYKYTYLKRGHNEHLSPDFFNHIYQNMREYLVLVLVYERDEIVAGALSFLGKNTLYGRYWGCNRDIPFMHFEACYYQGIEFCIENNIRYFDSGAQGPHKIKRGFKPTKTYSSHWIYDPAFNHLASLFLKNEMEEIDSFIDNYSNISPYRAQDL